MSADEDGDYPTITEALSAITDASSTNRYLITVKPRMYSETGATKSYVDIVGSGPENTKINVPASFMVEVYDVLEARLANIAVESISASGDGTGIDVLDSLCVIENVTVSVKEQGASLDAVGIMINVQGYGSVTIQQGKISAESKRDTYGIYVNGETIIRDS